MMKQFALAALMVFGATQAQTALALPDDPGAGMSAAQYDPVSGEIVVSINGVNNWFVQSTSFGLTGTAPVGLPIVPGSLPSDNDEIIGETAFGVGTGLNVSLGNVAAAGLTFGTLADDLTISWNAGLGSPLQTAPITLLGTITVTPPTAAINGPFFVDLPNGDPLNILLDASGSNDGGGVLTYDWDLDGSNNFLTAGAADGMLAIADVTATFGPGGPPPTGIDYPISVRVTNSAGFDIASTTVTIIPEPGTLALACMGLIGIASTRRRRSC